MDMEFDEKQIEKIVRILRFFQLLTENHNLLLQNVF
jgi:hypothetical protein